MYLNRMLLAPEDAPASGGGDPGGAGVSAAPPAASPSPAPAGPPAASAPRLPFVNPDLPLPASAGSGGPAPAPGATGGPPAPQDNPIPYSRVRQMLEQERQRVATELRREFASQRPDPRSQLEVVRQALRLAGIDVPDEQPAPPPSREEMQHFISQQFQEIRQQQAVESEYHQGVRELAAAEAQFADHFRADPTLKARVQALWGASGDKSMAQIVNEQIQALDAFYAARTQAYTRLKAGDRSVAPIRPGGTPGGARAPAHDLATTEGQDAALDEILDSMG